MKRILTLFLCLCMLLQIAAVLPFEAFAATDAKLTLEKTIFVQGEPINVTPQGSGKDWIGIAKKGEINAGAICWRYVGEGVTGAKYDDRCTGLGNVATDIRAAYCPTSKDPVQDLPVGEYTVFWVANNGYAKDYAYSVDIKIVMSTDKTTYTYGEPIMVTAMDSGTGKDWIGIAKKDAVTKGSVRYKYISKDVADQRPASKGLGDGVAFDIRTGAIAGNRDAQADIGPGVWTVFWVKSGMTAGQYETYSLDITVTDGPIRTDKLEYRVGEPINVTATVAGADTKTWYGIVPDENGAPKYSFGTILYRNLYKTVAEGETTETFNLRNYTASGSGKMGNATLVTKCAAYLGVAERGLFSLPAGTYWIVYCADSSTVDGGNAVTHKIQIKIKPCIEVEKTTFTVGEAINVTAYGRTAGDEVFITPRLETLESNIASSIRWKAFTSGVTFDMKTAKATAYYPDLVDLPAGEYSLFIIYKDENTSMKAANANYATRVDITVSGEAPIAPTDVTYVLDDKTTGLANGSVTVTIDPDAFADKSSKPTHAILYWGTESGPLDAYTAIGYRALTSASTVIVMNPSTVIPREATHLWVQAYNAAGVSKEMTSAALPADRTSPDLGNEEISFQIVSDVHSKANTTKNSHIERFFLDVKSIDPDSAGIFVSGDITDTGTTEEYINLYALWDKHLGSQSNVKIPFYPAIGNHEFKPDGTVSGYGDYASKKDRFIEYVNQYLKATGKTEITNGKHYYDLGIGDYHFIFLGSEYSGTNAYISDAQLKWLDETLAEDRKNGRPSFIMLHQCLYNTVAGGMPAHGWNGVIAGDENWETWKTTASNYVYDRTMKDTYEAPLRDILRKYPEAMMFSGHSHWEMSDVNNLYHPSYPTDDGNDMPNYLFNTGAVAYLASAMTGKDISGSQGYYVSIYGDYIEFRGRDLVNAKWIPNAYYRIALSDLCAHENADACASVCPDCQAQLTPIAHEGEQACSTVCKHCGDAVVTPTAEHEAEILCTSTACKNCGERIDPIAHEGEQACSTVCKHCGDAVVTPTAEHEAEILCTSASCKNCGEAITSIPHEGEIPCVSATCKYCGKAITPIPHDYGDWEELEGGKHRRVCFCGHEETKAHVWGDPTIFVPPSDTLSGMLVFYCTDCGAKKVEPLVSGDETTAPDTETTAPDTETTAPDTETTAPDVEGTEPDDETTVPSPESTTPETDPAKPEDPKPSVLLIVIVVAVVLCGAAAACFLVIRKKKA